MGQKGCDLLQESTSVPARSLRSLRARIGEVPQDMVLFNESIFYNIVYGKLGASREEVYAAARQAAIHDQVRRPAGQPHSASQHAMCAMVCVSLGTSFFWVRMRLSQACQQPTRETSPLLDFAEFGGGSLCGAWQWGAMLPTACALHIASNSHTVTCTSGSAQCFKFVHLLTLDLS